MITSIKSLAELIAITESRSKLYEKASKDELNYTLEASQQKKKDFSSKENKSITLPNILKETSNKWAKKKKAVSKFIDELDYNNQIQSTYDLTLIERQSYYDKKDAA